MAALAVGSPPDSRARAPAAAPVSRSLRNRRKLDERLRWGVRSTFGEEPLCSRYPPASPATNASRLGPWLVWLDMSISFQLAEATSSARSSRATTPSG